MPTDAEPKREPNANDVEKEARAQFLKGSALFVVVLIVGLWSGAFSGHETGILLYPLLPFALAGGIYALIGAQKLFR